MNGLPKDSMGGPDPPTSASGEHGWVKRRTLTVRPAAPGYGRALENGLYAIRQLNGVSGAEMVSKSSMSITYDLRGTNFEQINEALACAGIALENSLHSRLCYSMIRYMESIQRENAATQSGWSSYVRDIYVSRFQARRHGARDDRPQQWRKYMQPPTAGRQRPSPDVHQ
ncbi:MAG: hypothetical protein L0Z68_10040 [Gammaproteobacteria bacterium]|nr:hypothetical protein [Gammaproteobacteria bacterium]